MVEPPVPLRYGNALENYINLVPEVKLGRGSYGTIRRMKNKTTGATVAVKTMDMKELSAIVDEVHIYCSYYHPHLMEARELYFCPMNDSLHLDIIMEEGIGLLEFISRQNRIWDAILVYQLVDALSFLQENNIIYGDIKSSNIVVYQRTNGPQLKLTDFGLYYKWECGSVPILQTHTDLPGLKKRSSDLYQSPEVSELASHEYNVVHEAMWALGITILEMLTGGLNYGPKFRKVPLIYYKLATETRTTITPMLEKYSRTIWIDLLLNLLGPGGQRPPSFISLFPEAVMNSYYSEGTTPFPTPLYWSILASRMNESTTPPEMGAWRYHAVKLPPLGVSYTRVRGIALKPQRPEVYRGDSATLSLVLRWMGSLERMKDGVINLAAEYVLHYLLPLKLGIDGGTSSPEQVEANVSWYNIDRLYGSKDTVEYLDSLNLFIIACLTLAQSLIETENELRFFNFIDTFISPNDPYYTMKLNSIVRTIYQLMLGLGGSLLLRVPYYSDEFNDIVRNLQSSDPTMPRGEGGMLTIKGIVLRNSMNSIGEYHRLMQAIGRTSRTRRSTTTSNAATITTRTTGGSSVTPSTIPLGTSPSETQREGNVKTPSPVRWVDTSPVFAKRNVASPPSWVYEQGSM